MRSASQGAGNQRAEGPSWANDQLGLNKVTELSEEIQSMLSKPSAANQKEKIEIFNSQAQSVGSYIYKCQTS